jgi:hypothetical protein
MTFSVFGHLISPFAAISNWFLKFAYGFQVLTESHQSLAAEPGFRGDLPRRGGSRVTTIRRFPNHRSEPLEQQPENGSASALVPMASFD